jgi:hypothetical protein
LRLVGEVFALALVRKREQAKLLTAMAEIRALQSLERERVDIYWKPSRSDCRRVS